MPKPDKGLKYSLIRVAVYCVVFRVSSDKNKWGIILFLFFKVVVNVVLGTSKSRASFATFVPVSLVIDNDVIYFP